MNTFWSNILFTISGSSLYRKTIVFRSKQTFYGMYLSLNIFALMCVWLLPLSAMLQHGTKCPTETLHFVSTSCWVKLERSSKSFPFSFTGRLFHFLATFGILLVSHNMKVLTETKTKLISGAVCLQCCVAPVSEDFMACCCAASHYTSSH